MARADDESELSAVLAALAGAVGCMVVAGLLATVRDEVGQVVPALSLVVVVVLAAAVGGRLAGAYTAAAAALSFNFWHTQPYLSLRIHDANDVVDTVLLLVVGLAVGALAASRERRATEAAEDRAMLAALGRQADLVAAGASLPEVWAVTRRALLEHLGLASARFEPFGTEAPALARLSLDNLTGRTRMAAGTALRFLGGGFALPEGGAELAVRHHGDPLGRLVLVPGVDRGVSRTARRFALTLADQFAVAVSETQERPVLT